MPAQDKTVFVYATFPSPESAEEIGGALVEAHLAACVNILPQIISIYVWQGVRQRDSECAMIIKTRAARVDDVIQEVSARHPYDTPAIAVIPVEGGSLPFLDWIAQQTSVPGSG